MQGFWIVAVSLACIAAAILIVPLLRARQGDERVSVIGLLTAVAIVPVASGIYLLASNYDPEAPMFRGSAAETLLLGQRNAVQANPDDVDGWQRLAAIYRELGDYHHAAQSFEQAWRRSANPDDMLKLNYAESLLISDPVNSINRAEQLLTEVLENDPANGSALLLGGIAAMETGPASLAIERFSALLSLDPPPEIVDLVRQQIMVLAASQGEPAPMEGEGPSLEIEVALGDSMSLDGFGPNARVFVAARSPDSSMPILATQNPLSSVPGFFVLTNRDSMTGLRLEQFDTVTVLARISASGTATASPGDIYDEVTITLDSVEQPIRLVLDKVVPEVTPDG